jgi:hypothetical protein
MRRLAHVCSSDRQCEPGECCREVKAWRGVSGDFVVSAAEVLHEGMSSGDHGGGPEAFEPTHRPQPSLQPTVIGFYPIVCVLLGDMRCGWNEFVQRPQVRTQQTLTDPVAEHDARYGEEGAGPPEWPRVRDRRRVPGRLVYDDAAGVVE